MQLLYDKIVQVSLKQLSKLVPALESGSYNRIKQSNINANSWRKRNYNDGKIDWKMSSESIYNLIRALAKPYSGAHFIHKDKEYTVWKSEVLYNKNSNIEPGKVLFVDDCGITVKTADASIKLKKIEPKINILEGAYL